jgi:uroporphyrinogen-III synthase
VGAATSRALHDVGVDVAHEAAATALDLADVIAEGPVLVLGACAGRDELRAALAARAVRCDVVGCYDTRALELEESARGELARCDVVFIGAPSAWRVARAHVRADAWVLVPGPTTAEVVRAHHDRDRVLVGWGADFDAAWSRVSGR